MSCLYGGIWWTWSQHQPIRGPGSGLKWRGGNMKGITRWSHGNHQGIRMGLKLKGIPHPRKSKMKETPPNDSRTQIWDERNSPERHDSRENNWLSMHHHGQTRHTAILKINNLTPAPGKRVATWRRKLVFPQTNYKQHPTNLSSPSWHSLTIWHTFAVSSVPWKGTLPTVENSRIVR